MGTAIKHPVWASECPDVKNYKWRLNPVWHRMLYSCTHMATVGFKGLMRTKRMWTHRNWTIYAHLHCATATTLPQTIQLHEKYSRKQMNGMHWQADTEYATDDSPTYCNICSLCRYYTTHSHDTVYETRYQKPTPKLHSQTSKQTMEVIYINTLHNSWLTLCKKNSKSL